MNPQQSPIPTSETDAWRKQDMHSLERAFEFMERLERERDEARAELDELLHALKKARRYVEAYPALSIGASDERRAFLVECDTLVSKAEGGQQ